MDKSYTPRLEHKNPDTPVIAANQVGLLKALFKQLAGSLLLRHTGIQFAAIHNAPSKISAVSSSPMSCSSKISICLAQVGTSGPVACRRSAAAAAVNAANVVGVGFVVAEVVAGRDDACGYEWRRIGYQCGGIKGSQPVV